MSRIKHRLDPDQKNMHALQPQSHRVDCTSCPIGHRAVCAKCESEELAELNRIKIYKTFAAGQVIAIRGEELDMVASIVSGTATLTRSINDGRTQMIGLLLPSDFIGRPGRETAPYDITAVTDVTLCCFRKRPFERLLQDMPHVQERLLEMSLDELDAARDWMLLLGRKTARERIASLLSLIMKRARLPLHLREEGCQIELPITRETMANFLGLTIETVSRQLTGLAREGIIVIEGKRGIHIPDIAALLAETGDDTDGGIDY